MECANSLWGRGDNSVVCHADRWMSGSHETWKMICLLDTNPTRCMSTLEIAVREPVVMVPTSISETTICRKEVLTFKGRLLARRPKAEASTVGVSSAVLAPCLTVSGQEEKILQRRCELCQVIEQPIWKRIQASVKARRINQLAGSDRSANCRHPELGAAATLSWRTAYEATAPAGPLVGLH